jgi:hypothetical protein
MFALFHNGKQVSKTHENRQAVVIEAYEQKAVVDCGADFTNDTEGRYLAEGYEIKRL